MSKTKRTNVDKNVGSSKAPKKKKKYVKGKFPNTVLDTETKTLYVRKSVTINRMVFDPKTGKEKFVKQKQVWRVCHEQTSDAVKDILADIENDIALARAGRPKPLSLFSEIADHFSENHLTEAVFDKGKKVSGLIQLRMPKTFLKYLKNYFGSYRINEITFGDLLSYKRERLKTPVVSPKGKKRQRSLRSVNYELTVMKQIINYAVQLRWLDRSPFLDGKNLIETSAENKRDKTWTKDEEQKCLALCKGLYAHMKPVIILITDGGFRKEELLNSKWSEVDFEKGIMLARNYKGKSVSIRKVYLTARMTESLKEWKAIQEKRKRPDKSLVIGFKDVKHAWEYLREKIDRPDLHIHDLRHVFATRLSDRKNAIADISALLGHSSIKTTQIYINPTDERLRAASKTLED
jgi:integrase